jgi:hypothetical protein
MTRSLPRVSPSRSPTPIKNVAETDHFEHDHELLWDELGMDDVRPGRQQTPEQARNFRALSFQWICRLEGLPVPREEVIRRRWAEAESAGEEH